MYNVTFPVGQGPLEVTAAGKWSPVALYENGVRTGQARGPGGELLWKIDVALPGATGMQVVKLEVESKTEPKAFTTQTRLRVSGELYAYLSGGATKEISVRIRPTDLAFLSETTETRRTN